MNNFVDITVVDLPFSKEEINLQKEIKSLSRLIEQKQKEMEQKEKERNQLSINKITNLLSKNATKLCIGDVIYNFNTEETFVVISVNPLNISII